MLGRKREQRGGIGTCVVEEEGVVAVNGGGGKVTLESGPGGEGGSHEECPTCWGWGGHLLKASPALSSPSCLVYLLYDHEMILVFPSPTMKLVGLLVLPST